MTEEQQCLWEEREFVDRDNGDIKRKCFLTDCGEVYYTRHKVCYECMRKPKIKKLPISDT